MFSDAFRDKLLTVLLLLGMLVIFATPPVQAAKSGDIRSTCWAPAKLSEDIAAIANDAQRWSCNERFSLSSERVLLRFDLAAGEPPPQYLLSRRSAFETLHLLSIDQDGAVQLATIPASSLQSSMAGGYFKAPLPTVAPNTVQIIAAVDLPSHRMTLENAFLAPSDSTGDPSAIRSLLLLAGLAGMFIMPLIFNAAFYRVLREPFVLWHSALTLSLLMTIVVTSGLAVVLFDPPAMMLSWITTLIFGITIASGTMFTYSFVEPGKMHPLLRRLLPLCAGWAVLLSTFHAAFPYVARPIQSSAYTAAFAPILVIFILSMIDALRRGSRAAKYQAIGYTPIIIVGLIRLTTGIIPWSPSRDAMLLFYIGCICEVLFTTLGMADRFVTMKRERDRALAQAGLLGQLSETDALTGLFNRRGLEHQFHLLRAEGFNTLAVIDLDHFKSINDANGHAVGDIVLRAAANALQTGPDVRAYRLGGEEFVLLLRGDDADLQAEFRRQAIPVVIANQVAGLQRPVTASMGVTPLQDNEDFTAPYQRADKLLYEAKSAGRNRTRSSMSAQAHRTIPRSAAPQSTSKVTANLSANP